MTQGEERFVNKKLSIPPKKKMGEGLPASSFYPAPKDVCVGAYVGMCVDVRVCAYVGICACVRACVRVHIPLV